MASGRTRRGRKCFGSGTLTRKDWVLKTTQEVKEMTFHIGDGVAIEDLYSLRGDGHGVNMFYLADTWSLKNKWVGMRNWCGKQLGWVYLSRPYYARHGHFLFRKTSISTPVPLYTYSWKSSTSSREERKK